MILIADSGATKTHWTLISDQAKQSIHTQGISPFYQDEEQITTILNKELKPELDPKNIHNIYFYGTGISQEDKRAIVANSLATVFPDAECEVEHDLLAAARAACGHEAGITCILGTGSNSCLFDGEQIVDNVPSLGFILGDEGSGASLGRNLLKAYYYRELPEELREELERWRNMSKATVLTSIYDADKPSKETAEYARFVIEQQEHPFIKELCRQEFMAFFKATVLKYEHCKELPINFVGSIAYLSQHLINELLQQLALKPGRYLQEPMDELIVYHNQHD